MNSFSVKCVIMWIAAGSSYAMVFWNLCWFWAEWGLLGSLSQLADSSQISDHANVVIIGTAVVKLFTHLKTKQINKHSRSSYEGEYRLVQNSTKWCKQATSGEHASCQVMAFYRAYKYLRYSSRERENNLSETQFQPINEAYSHMKDR